VNNEKSLTGIVAISESINFLKLLTFILVSVNFAIGKTLAVLRRKGASKKGFVIDLTSPFLLLHIP